MTCWNELSILHMILSIHRNKIYWNLSVPNEFYFINECRFFCWIEHKRCQPCAFKIHFYIQNLFLHLSNKPSNWVVSMFNNYSCKNILKLKFLAFYSNKKFYSSIHFILWNKKIEYFFFIRYYEFPFQIFIIEIFRLLTHQIKN